MMRARLQCSFLKKCYCAIFALGELLKAELAKFFCTQAAHPSYGFSLNLAGLLTQPTQQTVPVLMPLFERFSFSEGLESLPGNR